MNDTEGSAWERKVPASAVYVERDGGLVPLSEVLTDLDSGEVTIAWDDIQDVPEEFPPAAHTHTTADVDGLGQLASADSVAWGDVAGKPTTFAPSTHTHTIAQVDGLQAALDAITGRLDVLEAPEA